MKQIICQFCNKKIEGFTEKQLEYLLKQHILAKHPEKIKIEGEKQ